MKQVEAIILGLVVESYSINADLMGMQANDKYETNGNYTEEAYLTCAKRLKDISEEIKTYAIGMG